MDVQARVIQSKPGDEERVSLYFFSDDKTDGGASKRYALLAYEEDGWTLTLGHWDPDAVETVEFGADDMPDAMVRAFEHVQSGPSLRRMTPARQPCPLCGAVVNGALSVVGEGTEMVDPIFLPARGEAGYWAGHRPECPYAVPGTTSSDEPPTRDDLPKLPEERRARAALPKGEKLVDAKVSDVGGGLLVGFLAGAVAGAALKHIGDAVTKMPCARCGRAVIDHKKGDACETYVPKMYDPSRATSPAPSRLYVVGEWVVAAKDIHFAPEIRTMSGWKQVPVSIGEDGFTIPHGARGQILFAADTYVGVRWSNVPAATAAWTGGFVDVALDGIRRLTPEDTTLDLPGWLCPTCGVFTGTAKEQLTKCRSCDAPRPA